MMDRNSARQFLQGLWSFCDDQVTERDIARDEDALMELVNKAQTKEGPA